MACRTCAKGTFSESKASPNCTNCPMSWFQSQDEFASTECISCPSGWEQNLEGESSCVDLDLGGIKIDDCSDKQYWIQNKDNTANCNACPAGGTCKGDINISTILPLFGWWPVPNDIGEFSEPVFVECLYHPACLGEPNLALEKKYYDKDNRSIDLALVVAKRNTNDTTNTMMCDISNGYRNDCTGIDSNTPSTNCTSNCSVQCRLCATCKKNYKRVGNAAQCQPCPGSAENKLWLGLGFFIMILGTTILVYMEINSETSEDETSDTVKKIILNFLQVSIFSLFFLFLMFLHLPRTYSHLKSSSFFSFSDCIFSW